MRLVVENPWGFGVRELWEARYFQIRQKALIGPLEEEDMLTMYTADKLPEPAWKGPLPVSSSPACTSKLRTGELGALSLWVFGLCLLWPRAASCIRSDGNVLGAPGKSANKARATPVTALCHAA